MYVQLTWRQPTMRSETGYKKCRGPIILASATLLAALIRVEKARRGHRIPHTLNLPTAILLFYIGISLRLHVSSNRARKDDTRWIVIAEKQHILASTARPLHADSTRPQDSSLQVYGVHVVLNPCPLPNISYIDELPLTGRSYMYISSSPRRTNQEKL